MRRAKAARLTQALLMLVSAAALAWLGLSCVYVYYVTPKTLPHLYFAPVFSNAQRFLTQLRQLLRVISSAGALQPGYGFCRPDTRSRGGG